MMYQQQMGYNNQGGHDWYDDNRLGYDQYQNQNQYGSQTMAGGGSRMSRFANQGANSGGFQNSFAPNRNFGGTQNFGGYNQQFGQTGMSRGNYGGHRQTMAGRGGRRGYGRQADDTLTQEQIDRMGRPRKVGFADRKESQFRDLCLLLMQEGAGMKPLQTAIKGFVVQNRKIRSQVVYYEDVLSKVLENMHKKEFDFNQVRQMVYRTMEDFMQGGDNVMALVWMERLMFEMDKFILQQRAFIQFKKRMEWFGVKSLTEVLQKLYKIQPIQDDMGNDAISVLEFCRVLEKFGCLRSNERQDQKLITDEYGYHDRTREDQIKMEMVSGQESKLNPNSQSIQNTDQKLPTEHNQDDGQGFDQKRQEKEQEEAIEKQAKENLSKEKTDDIKFMHMLISLKQLEEDFQMFDTQIIPSVVNIVNFFLMDSYHQTNQVNLSMFFGIEDQVEEDKPFQNAQESNRNQDQSARKPETQYFGFKENIRYDMNGNIERDQQGLIVLRKQGEYTKYLTTFYLNEILETLISDQYTQGRVPYFKNAIKIYTQAKSNFDSTKISFAVIFNGLMTYLGGEADNIIKQNKELSVQVKRDVQQQITRFICSELNQNEKNENFEVLFNPREGLNNQNFRKILAKNFDVKKLGCFDVATLNDMMSQYSYANRNTEEFSINVNPFLVDIKAGLKEYKKVEHFIEKMSTDLIEKGQDLVQFFQNIVGMKAMETAKVSLDTIMACLKNYKIQFDPDQLRLTFDHFDQPEPDCVFVDDFINAAKAMRSTFTTNDARRKAKAAPLLKARRNYGGDVEEMKRHIAKVIEEYEVKNLGQLLKGQDYTNEDKIRVDDLFSTLEAIPDIIIGPEGLKKGDLIDLVNEFDVNKDGFVDLKYFKQHIDKWIRNDSNNLLLVSNVEEIINENVCDFVGEVEKLNVVDGQGQSLKKPIMQQDLAIDIWCAMVNQDKNFDEHFGSYSTKMSGRLDQAEFFRATDALQTIKYDPFEAEEIFSYLLQLDRAQNNTETQDQDGSFHPSDFIGIQFLKKRLRLEIGNDNRPENLVKQVMEQVVRELGNKKSAVMEVLNIFRIDENENESKDGRFARKNDFSMTILDYLKLTRIMTDPKRNLLTNHYLNERFDLIDIKSFYEDLRATELRMQKRGLKVKFYEYENQIPKDADRPAPDSQKDQRTILKPKPKKQNFVEPTYEVRSPFNTYLTVEEAQRVPSHLTADSIFAVNLRDIMIRTRAKGLSVEAYLQKYGKRTQTGTELSFDQFRLAVKSLGLDWADDYKYSKQVFKELDKNFDRADRGSLDMTELPKAIISSMSQTVKQIELGLLDIMYEHISENNLLNNLRDVVVYYNFQRDFGCSGETFLQIFRKNFEIPEDLITDHQVMFLAQRYAYQNIGLMGENKTQFFYYRLFEEIGMRRKDFEFKLQHLVQFVQDFYKGIAIYMSDIATYDQFLQRVGDERTNEIRESEFINACYDIHLEETYTQDQMKQYLGELGLAKPNHYGEPAYLLTSVVEGIQKHDVKNLAQLYDQTLINIYIMTKRNKKNTDVMTLFTQIDILDGQADNYVSVQQFKELMMTISSQGLVTPIDCEFLSMKYRNQRAITDDKVYYKNFYADFEELEEQNLGGKIFGLTKEDDAAFKRDKMEDPLAVKVPQKYLDFYAHVEKWITERRKKSHFIDVMVKYDRTKEGHLTARQIHDCFDVISCDMKPKQIGQLVYPLHKDSYGRYNYPELIEFLFGRDALIDTLKMYGIDELVTSHITKAELSKKAELKLSKSLKLECEFRYEDLESAQTSLTDGLNELRPSDVHQVFKKVGIKVFTKDREMIEAYTKRYASKDRGRVVLQDMLDFFKITKRLVNLISIFRGFFESHENALKANKALKDASWYSFEELIQFLQMVEFDMSLTEYNAPKKTTPENYRKAYGTLHDLYLGMKGSSELNRAMIMTVFKIQKFNLAEDQDADMQPGASGEKPKAKAKSRVDKKKRFANFKDFVRTNKYRTNRILNLDYEEIDYDQFEDLMVDIGFIDKKEAYEMFFEMLSEGQDKINMDNMRMALQIRKTVRSVSVSKRIKDKDKEQEDPSEFNRATKDLLDKVNKFLKANGKSDNRVLFKEMDKDGSMSVDLNEFVYYFDSIKRRNAQKGKQESQLDKKINKENMTILFKALDSDKSGSLDLQEFTTFLGYMDKLAERKIANIDSESLAALNLQIERLFRKVDNDSSGFIEAEELWRLLRPLNPGLFTLADVNQIIQANDANSDGKIDEDEFIQIVRQVLIEHMAKPLENVADFRKRLDQADRDKDGYLSTDELKTCLLEGVGVKNLSDSDIEQLVKFFNNKKQGYIDISELVSLVRDSGNIDFARDAEQASLSDAEVIRTAQKCILMIKNAVGFDLFSYFSYFGDKQLPDFFEPSFLQPVLEKKRENQPSQGLLKSSKAQGNQSGLQSDAEPEVLIDYKDTEGISRLKAPNGIYTLKLQGIENVPTPMKSSADKAFKMEDVLRREVRVIMIDQDKQELVSNVHIIPADVDKSGQSWKFDHESIQLHTELILKTDVVSKDISVLFELVMVLKGLKEGEEFQVTNGWGKVDMRDVRATKLNKIEIFGGSPTSSVQIDASKLEKKVDKNTGIFSFFAQKPKDSETSFFMEVECSLINSNKLSTMEKISYTYLPYNFLVSTAMLDLTLATQMQRLSVQNPKQDFLVCQTRKYWNNTDLLVMMTYVWRHFFSIEALVGDKHMSFEEKIVTLAISVQRVALSHQEQQYGQVQRDGKEVQSSNIGYFSIRCL